MENVQSNSPWISCQICGNKIRTKVYEDTVLIKFSLFCPECRNETCIDVVKLKMS